MANRAQRRAMMRSQTGKTQSMIAQYTKQARIAGLIQNGITPQDLKDEHDAAFADGYTAAGLNVMKCCYAAVCIAAHEEFGFGKERCYRLLKALDEKVMWALDELDMVDEVLDRVGLEIDFTEPFERVMKI